MNKMDEIESDYEVSESQEIESTSSNFTPTKDHEDCSSSECSEIHDPDVMDTQRAA